MKKNIIIGVAGIGIVVALLFGFKALLNRSEDRESITTKQKEETSLDLDLERKYPKYPNEVVEAFAKINKYVYSNDVSEEKMKEIVEETRLLYDRELLEKNSFDLQFGAFSNELVKADSVQRKIMNYEVDRRDQVEYKENKYGELALVNATFYLKEENGYPSEKYTFVLRKDEEGLWKILGWDYADKLSEEPETATP